MTVKNIIRNFLVSHLTPRLYPLLYRMRTSIIAEGGCKGLIFSTFEALPAYLEGTYETPLQKVLLDLLKPGDIFYDIGANQGFFSLLGARAVGSEGRVIAFEPVANNAARIREHARLNRFRQIHVIERAVSDHTGKELIWITAFSGGATLAATGTKPSDTTRKIEINSVSLDDFVLIGKLPPPVLIKIDVEGAEVMALTGMAQTINHFRPTIIYEIDDGNLDRFTAKEHEIGSFLSTFGYISARLEDSYSRVNWLVGHYVAKHCAKG